MKGSVYFWKVTLIQPYSVQKFFIMALKVANTTIRELELSLNHEIWFIFSIQVIMKHDLIVITCFRY